MTCCADRHLHWRVLAAICCLLVVLLATMPGCAVAYLAGGMAQNYEYQKELIVPPAYEDLEGRSVAVVVNADMTTQYQFKDLVTKVSGGVAGTLQQEVPNILVKSPREVLRWQYATPQWSAQPLAEIAEQLNVERVVYIDILEFRLHPPGNTWEWEGVASAHVGVINRDGIMPDMFEDEFQVVARFPDVDYLDRAAATSASIDFGLTYEFIKRIGWLFYEHREPKYPDRFQQ